MANGTIAASQIEMLSQSGTGIITITPPATNTNRAITLPDAAGAIVVSGTTPSLNGITFPATQVASADANTLDDYEEGTWTPADGSGAGLTFAGTSGNCFYTKIGAFVIASFRIVYPSTADATQVLISGLPFTVISTTNNPIFGGFFSETTDVQITVGCNPNSVGFRFRAYGTSTPRTNAQSSGKDYRGVIIYMA